MGPVSLEVGDDWTLSTVVLAGPLPTSGVEALDDDALPLPAATFQPNLVVTMEQVEGDVTPQIYVRQQLEGLRKAQVMRQTSRAPEIVKLASGRDALLTEQILVGPGGDSIRQLQLVTIKAGVAFTLIASALDGPSYAQDYDRFRRMLLSFR